MRELAVTMIVSEHALTLAADPDKADEVALELGRILLMGAQAILAEQAARQNGHAIDSPDDIERLIRGDDEPEVTP
jgi:hypothetical protein